MCGIAGRAGARGSWVPDQALAALAHRGPDATGVDELQSAAWSCTIAHTRLAINDLTDSVNQPLYNEDETLALVFNGEIYNFPELRRLCEAKGHIFRSRSDGEVIHPGVGPQPFPPTAADQFPQPGLLGRRNLGDDLFHEPHTTPPRAGATQATQACDSSDAHVPPPGPAR